MGEAGPRRRGGGILLLCLSTILCVGALEFAGRHYLTPEQLYFANNVDHRLKPHDAKAQTNGDGIRCAWEADHFKAEDFNVVFLGDSFVYGLGVPKLEQTIPAQFETLASEQIPGGRIRAIDFGWLSASPLLSYRQLREIGRKYHPRLVVECVDMTDIHDDLKYSRLLNHSGTMGMVPVLPITTMSLHKLLSTVPALHGLHQFVFGFPARRFFVADAPLEKTRKYYSTIRADLRALNHYCHDELGADFAVFVLPRSFQYSNRECPDNWEGREYRPLGPYALEPFRYFDELRRAESFPIYSLLPEFRATTEFPTCLTNDPHWNATGNRIAATAIFTDLKRDGRLPAG